MNYTETLTRAWRITWSNKALWFFGLLASCARGNGGGGGGGGDGGGDFELEGPGAPPPQFEDFGRQIGQSEVVGLILVVACLGLLLALLLIGLSVLGEAGLIGGVRRADEAGQVTFREAWEAGVRYFWPVLGARLVLIVPVLLFLLLTGGLLLVAPLGLICLVPLVCVFVVVMFALSVIQVLATRAIVLQGSGVIDGYRNGWELLKANIGPMIVFGVILFVVGLLVGLVSLIPLAIVVVPFIMAFAADPGNPNIMLLISGGLALLCVLPILLFIGSITTTWDSAVWTLAYQHFIDRRAAPPAAASSPAL